MKTDFNCKFLFINKKTEMQNYKNRFLLQIHCFEMCVCVCVRACGGGGDDELKITGYRINVYNSNQLKG
jgi:hypothetical protein